MKPKLLLLHGALGSKKQFAKAKISLNENFETFDLNFSGHGGEKVDQEFSMALFAQNVIEYLEQQKINSINIFGYSMGGYVALHLAKHYPERVEKIVTLGTKFDWNPISASKEVKMLNPEKIEEKVPKFAEMLQKVHEPEDWKRVMQKTAEMMISLGDGAHLQLEDLRQIDCPVQIGIGSLDNMVSLQESESAAKSIPNGQLKVIESFPHPINKIDPQQLVDYIQSAFA